jgi:hypothetical protein
MLIIDFLGKSNHAGFCVKSLKEKEKQFLNFCASRSGVKAGLRKHSGRTAGAETG